MLEIQYYLQESLYQIEKIFLKEVFITSKKGLFDFKDLYNYLKEYNHYKDNPESINKYYFAWIDKIKDLNCIHLKNETLNYSFVIVMHTHKYLNLDGYTCFKVYDNSNSIKEMTLSYLENNIDILLDEIANNDTKPTLKYPILPINSIEKSIYSLDLEELRSLSDILEVILDKIYI